MWQRCSQSADGTTQTSLRNSLQARSPAMSDRHNTPAPPPDALAARFELGLDRTQNIPWGAAQWLTDGFDGPALRELAGLNGRDLHEASDLLPDALAEMGVA